MTATTQVRHAIVSREDTLKVRITSAGEVHHLVRGPHGDGQKRPVWLLYAATIREAAVKAAIA